MIPPENPSLRRVHRGCPSHDEAGTASWAELSTVSMLKVDLVSPDDPLGRVDIGVDPRNPARAVCSGFCCCRCRHDGSFLNGCSIV